MKELYKKELYKLSLKAYEENEVPISALIVKNDKIIARAYNKKENTQDVSAHAEILALKEASEKIGTWKLEDCQMYVSLEPCLMCYSAIKQSRIKDVYIYLSGNKDKDYVYSKYIKADGRFTYLDDGEEFKELMTSFFNKRR